MGKAKTPQSEFMQSWEIQQTLLSLVLLSSSCAYARRETEATPRDREKARQSAAVCVARGKEDFPELSKSLLTHDMSREESACTTDHTARPQPSEFLQKTGTTKIPSYTQARTLVFAFEVAVPLDQSVFIRTPSS